MSNENGGCGTCGDAKGDGDSLSANNNSAPAERLGSGRPSSKFTDPVIVPYSQEPTNIPVSFRSDQVLRGLSADLQANPGMNAAGVSSPTLRLPKPDAVVGGRGHGGSTRLPVSEGEPRRQLERPLPHSEIIGLLMPRAVTHAKLNGHFGVVRIVSYCPEVRGCPTDPWMQDGTDGANEKDRPPMVAGEDDDPFPPPPPTDPRIDKLGGPYKDDAEGLSKRVAEIEKARGQEPKTFRPFDDEETPEFKISVCDEDYVFDSVGKIRHVFEVGCEVDTGIKWPADGKGSHSPVIKEQKDNALKSIAAHEQAKKDCEALEMNSGKLLERVKEHWRDKGHSGGTGDLSGWANFYSLVSYPAGKMQCPEQCKRKVVSILRWSLVSGPSEYIPRVRLGDQAERTKMTEGYRDIKTSDGTLAIRYYYKLAYEIEWRITFTVRCVK